MRFVLAIIMLITFQFKAEAQESTGYSTSDFSSTASSSPDWGKSRDVFVDKSVERSKVKAFVRDLLGEDRPPATAVPTETSAGSQTAE